MSPASRRAQWGPVRPVLNQGGGEYYQGGPGSYYSPGYQHLPPLHSMAPQQQQQQQQAAATQQGFMLHSGGQQPHSLPAPAHQAPGGAPNQPMYHNGQPYYPTPQPDPHYRGGYPQHQDPQYRGGGYPPQPHQPYQQTPDGGRGTAPFRLHSGDGGDDSRGPSSLRSSTHSSPSRQPLQPQYQHHYNNHANYQPPYTNYPPYHQPGQQPYNQLSPVQPPPQQQMQLNQSNQSNNLPLPPAALSTRGSKPESSSAIHSPVAAPPPDDMEPQDVSFIDSSQEQNNSERVPDRSSQEREKSQGQQQQRVSLSSNRGRSSTDTGEESPTTERLKRMSIGSGSRTYRITHDGTSPTRPTVGAKTFRVPTKRGTPMQDDDADLPQPTPHQRSLSPPYQADTGAMSPEETVPEVKTEPLADGTTPDKGFYISFDDAPRKPKPPLRAKKFSRKSSTPATPVTTPSKEDFPVIPDVAPLRTSRLPSNGSLDITPNNRLPQRSSPFSPTSPYTPTSPYSPTESSTRPPLFPISNVTSPRSLAALPHAYSPASSTTSPRPNGFSYSEGGRAAHDSPTESSEDTTDAAEVAVKSSAGLALVIGNDLINQEQSSISDMERKKQKLMIMSMRRKQQQEEHRRTKENEAEAKREDVKHKEEAKLRKKEEERQRREIILEKHKIKKAIEEAEKEGRYYQPPAWYLVEQASQASSKASSVRLRHRGPSGGGAGGPGAGGGRPRPKTMHEAEGSLTPGGGGGRLLPSRRNRGSTHNIAPPPDSGGGSGGPGVGMRKSSGRWGSSHSLSRATGSRGSTNSLSGDYPSSSRTLDRGHLGRRPTSAVGGSSGSLLRQPSTKSLYGSRSRLTDHESAADYQVHAAPRRRPSGPDGGGGGSSGGSMLRRPSNYQQGTYNTGGGGAGGYRRPSATRKYRSTGNLSGASEHDSLVYGMSEDSGLGRATPPRRAASPSMAGLPGAAPVPGLYPRHLPSPSHPPGSLPPGMVARGGRNSMAALNVFDDAASDISTASSTMDFTGPRLYKQPTSKSNRPIVLNAVEFCVFPGAVNQHNKLRVMEEIARSEAKHFLFLFRDTGCQFRGLYSYNPETDEVDKLHGTGPRKITENMFDKFFKYNSGAKSFSLVHTKHLTATIDAFTIHNALWQGKRVSLPSRKDMALVI